MRVTAILAAVAATVALAGCQTPAAVTAFFGTSDPCAIGDATYATFLTAAAKEPKVAKYKPQMRTAYAAFKAQCSDGQPTKVTMKKLLDAYLAAIDTK